MAVDLQCDRAIEGCIDRYFVDVLQRTIVPDTFVTVDMIRSSLKRPPTLSSHAWYDYDSDNDKDKDNKGFKVPSLKRGALSPSTQVKPPSLRARTKGKEEKEEKESAQGMATRVSAQGKDSRLPSIVIEPAPVGSWSATHVAAGAELTAGAGSSSTVGTIGYNFSQSQSQSDVGVDVNIEGEDKGKGKGNEEKERDGDGNGEGGADIDEYDQSVVDRMADDYDRANGIGKYENEIEIEKEKAKGNHLYATYATDVEHSMSLSRLSAGSLSHTMPEMDGISPTQSSLPSAFLDQDSIGTLEPISNTKKDIKEIKERGRDYLLSSKQSRYFESLHRIQQGQGQEQEQGGSTSTAEAEATWRLESPRISEEWKRMELARENEALRQMLVAVARRQGGEAAAEALYAESEEKNKNGEREKEKEKERNKNQDQDQGEEKGEEKGKERDLRESKGQRDSEEKAPSCKEELNRSDDPSSHLDVREGAHAKRADAVRRDEDIDPLLMMHPDDMVAAAIQGLQEQEEQDDVASVMSDLTTQRMQAPSPHVISYSPDNNDDDDRIRGSVDGFTTAMTSGGESKETSDASKRSRQPMSMKAKIAAKAKLEADNKRVIKKMLLLQRAEKEMLKVEEQDAKASGTYVKPKRERFLSDLRTLPEFHAERTERVARKVITDVRIELSNNNPAQVSKKLSKTEKLLLESPLATPFVDLMRDKYEKEERKRKMQELKDLVSGKK